MERKYKSQFFYEKIEKIRKARPNISITTDVIVGFPYETEAEFKNTLEFIKKIKFSKLHVFPYSVRKGTKASTFPQISDAVKKDRTRILLDLSKTLEESYAKKFIHQKVDVILEKSTSLEEKM